MKAYPIDKKRVICFAGHAGGGKTQCCEAILAATKVVPKIATIESGQSNLDFEPEEQKRLYSVSTSFWDVDYKNHGFFLMDTPGGSNFHSDTKAVMTAAGSVVFAIDATEGAKFQHDMLSEYADRLNLPHMVFISKMEKERANFDQAVASAKDSLAVEPVVMALPIGVEDGFKGVVDLISQKAYLIDSHGKSSEIPADMADAVAEARETMIERLVEADEELMEKFLEEGEVSDDELFVCLKKGTINRDFAPLYVGSGLSGAGIEVLLDAFINALPNPTQEPARIFHPVDSTEEKELVISEDGPLFGRVIKTSNDPFSGKVNVIRVYRGVLTSDATLHIPAKNAKEKVGKIYRIYGKKQEVVEELKAGEIGAFIKLKELSTGYAFNEDKGPDPLDCDALEIPAPMVNRTVAPKAKGEEDKMGAAINKLIEEDIGLYFWREEQTKDFILSGVGDAQFSVATEKMKRKFNVEVMFGEPKIPYRETIKGKSEKQGRYKKQSGGRGQFGDCHIRIKPQPRGEGYLFVDSIVGGVIPRNFIPAVDKGIQEAMLAGELTGNPVVDVCVELFFGSYHSVDSSEMAFKMAGTMAWRVAMMEANPCILEPIMKVDIVVPGEFMGDVFGNVSSRRGKVLGNENKGKLEVVHAELPQAEMGTLAQDIQAMTSDRGYFVSTFDHYEEVPSSTAEKIIEDYRKKKEEQ